MVQAIRKIPISQIILDEKIYPRSGIYPKRVSMFAENIRDGFKTDPIEVQIHPDDDSKYRILDGAHRLNAYKEIGATEIPVHIITLDGIDPLLYAAQKAIGPLQLNEEEARDTARRAYQNNPLLTSHEIGQAIGRSRRTVDRYTADLRAAFQEDLDLKIFRMKLLMVPQERIAKRLAESRETIRDHLADSAMWPNPPNTDLKKGFTVPQVAEKHGWPEPLVWAIALEGEDDLQRFKALKWGLWAWDVWNCNDCDKRFGDDWPGRIPAQMIDDYLHLIKKSGWQRTHIMQAPLSSERFNAGVVAAMQKKKISGVTSRYVIISKKE